MDGDISGCRNRQIFISEQPPYLAQTAGCLCNSPLEEAVKYCHLLIVSNCTSSKNEPAQTYHPNKPMEKIMSFWQIFGKSAVSDQGETIQRVSDHVSVSSNGTTYTRMGSTTTGSDGSIFTQMGNFSSDGSARMDSAATGLGAVFNKKDEW